VWWVLYKAFYGTRRASRPLSDFAFSVLRKDGAERIAVCDSSYYRAATDTATLQHGDHFFCRTPKGNEKMLDELLAANFLIKIGPKVGPGFETEGFHLKCRLGWSAAGFTWEGDPSRVEKIAKALDAKATERDISPGSKNVGKTARDACEELPPDRVAIFRSESARCLYVSEDRPEIQYAVRDLLEGMQTPLIKHELRLKRLATFLVSYPRLE